MKAKKSYGQHFLKEESMAKRIADSLQLRHTYNDLLEVGPGMGMLTKYLLQYKEHQPRVLVSEADKDMVAYLTEHYPVLAPNIVPGDFLKMNLKTHLTEQFGLIGNYPYNISSQIIFRMLEYREQIPEMVGMFQYEVAQRICAKEDTTEYGVLSVLVQAYYHAQLLFQVKPGNFNPPPKVNSAVIRLTRKPSLDIGIEFKLLRSVVKVTFGQRRKMLRNTMLSFLPKELLQEDDFFKRRPETLSVQEFIDLAKRVAQYRIDNPSYNQSSFLEDNNNDEDTTE